MPAADAAADSPGWLDTDIAAWRPVHMVRPSVGNLFFVTILAVVGITIAKAAMRIFPVRGLSDLIGGV